MDLPFPEGMDEDIRDFFDNVHPNLKPGLDLYPEVFTRPLFFPLQRQRELVQMIQIARTVDPKTIYEIGTDKGGGLYHWCMCFPEVERVIACEIRGTPYREVFERAFPDIDFLWLEASSRDGASLDSVYEFLNDELIDVLFIDGDKGEFAADFDLYLPLMNPQGIVFMHDVQDSVPRGGYLQVIEKGNRGRGYEHEEIIDKSEAIESLAKSEEQPEPRNAHDAWLRYWKGASCGVGVIHLQPQEVRS